MVKIFLLQLENGNNSKKSAASKLNENKNLQFSPRNADKQLNSREEKSHSSFININNQPLQNKMFVDSKSMTGTEDTQIRSLSNFSSFASEEQPTEFHNGSYPRHNKIAEKQTYSPKFRKLPHPHIVKNAPLPQIPQEKVGSSASSPDNSVEIFPTHVSPIFKYDKKSQRDIKSSQSAFGKNAPLPPIPQNKPGSSALSPDNSVEVFLTQVSPMFKYDKNSQRDINSPQSAFGKNAPLPPIPHNMPGSSASSPDNSVEVFPIQVSHKFEYDNKPQPGINMKSPNKPQFASSINARSKPPIPQNKPRKNALPTNNSAMFSIPQLRSSSNNDDTLVNQLSRSTISAEYIPSTLLIIPSVKGKINSVESSLPVRGVAMPENAVSPPPPPRPEYSQPQWKRPVIPPPPLRPENSQPQWKTNEKMSGFLNPNHKPKRSISTVRFIISIVFK